LSDTADLTHAVLLRVAEFIKKLPVDQLNELADGTAKLALVSKNSRPAKPATQRPTVSADEVRAQLSTETDIDAATRYVNGLPILVTQLRALANELGVGVRSGAKKEVVVAEIVRHLVTRRLDFDALSRPAPARF
jgi:hypothetical protein